MAAARKLLAEIDRTLKKIAEGNDAFDEIWDKVYSAPSASQKEKFEADLKKEIKKLQRLRDQVKTWLQSNEVKDKTNLMKARKDVESRMERFKVCEKETKTKAFSKQGLAAAEKDDPEEIARDEAREWINSSIGELQILVDACEAEIESLHSKGGKKKKKQDMAKLDEINAKMSRHTWHTGKLEEVLRSVDNESVHPDQLQDIKEGVSYYLESHDDPDFYEDEELYDDLDLCGVEVNMDLGVNEKDASDSRRESQQAESSKETAKQKKAAEKERRKEQEAREKSEAEANASSSGHSQTPQSKALAHAQSSAQGKLHAQQEQQRRHEELQRQKQQAQMKLQDEQRKRQEEQRKRQEELMLRKREAEKQRAAEEIANAKGGPAGVSDSSGPSGMSASTASKGRGSDSVLTEGKRDDERAGDFGQDDMADGVFSRPLAGSALAMLDRALETRPIPTDGERPKVYNPRNPCKVPASFPTAPLPVEYSFVEKKLDQDTLFFIFYQQQGSFPQYQAARELKKQSWRYHKKYLTWFQRHKDPTKTTEEFEQGTYVYFDYDTEWDKQLKANFTFEYSFLEDELTPS